MLALPKTATPSSSASSSSWCQTDGCDSKTPSTSAMARGRSSSARQMSPCRAGPRTTSAPSARASACGKEGPTKATTGR